jgi:hypothetical protein
MVETKRSFVAIYVGKKIAIRWLYTLHKWEVPNSTSKSSKEHIWFIHRQGLFFVLPTY